MKNEDAIKWLIKPTVTSTEVSPTKAKEIEAYNMAVDALSTKAIQGEWKLDPNGMDWNIPAWRCSECGFVANYIGVSVNDLGNNPMNWAGSNFCPNCGAKMNKGGAAE